MTTPIPSNHPNVLPTGAAIIRFELQLLCGRIELNTEALAKNQLSARHIG